MLEPLNHSHATTPAVTADAKIAVAIAELETLDRDGLRARWKAVIKRDAPPYLPRWLMFRILAYRVQAAAYGDLDRASVRLLDGIADELEKQRGQANTSGRRRNVSVSIPPAPRAPIRPGTILVREHEQKLHHVVVTKDGFSWNGAEFGSLSEVAFAITGTRWNGPRFFGLRAKTARNGAAASP
nr:DUF2924 domain-containing protein [Variibacter gotjawalensis]